MIDNSNTESAADAQLKGATVSPFVSVVIPVFNERSTLVEIVDRVRRLYFVKEIVIVDDCSTDGTTFCVETLARSAVVRAFYFDRNYGKGAAIRKAFEHICGDIVVIQDADLEYDPRELEKLIAPIVYGRADVVYGSRFRNFNQNDCSFWRYAANRVLTVLSNCFTGLRLTDMETCYKAMTREVVKALSVRENRFGIEPELTAKIARGRWRVVEVAVRYYPRGYSAGKKIGFRDGLRAIWCIVRYSRWD